MRLTWTRRYPFQSVHSLTVGPQRELRHGHQYYLEVSFEGRDIDAVDQVVSREILDGIDRQELDLSPSPTCEVLVNFIAERLRASTIGKRVRGVALQETAKNRFVAPGSEYG
ncbi:MAG TPA: 6-carboxytetrahydropterin synthase [Bdellovibrionales bacterium]|nr:6-carboxytetrahydropterin synthase [Bdellovibrionales bacterium]